MLTTHVTTYVDSILCVWFQSVSMVCSVVAERVDGDQGTS